MSVSFKLIKKKIGAVWTDYIPDGLKLLLVSVFITICMAAIFWKLCPPQFTETNDDAVMSWFVYGYYGDYSPYLCFINVVVGYAIIALLHIAPHVAWYTIFQLAIVLTSATVLNYLLLKRMHLNRALLCITFLYVFFGGDIFSKLQFTKTAGLALISGSLLLFEARAYAKEYKIAKTIIGCILILLGSLYRFKTMYVIFALMLGVGCWIFAETLKDHNWRRFLGTLIPFLAIFVICFGFHIYDSHVYQSDSGWEEYKELNKLRVALTNLKDDPDTDTCWPDYEENVDVYQAVGITYEDYQLFQTSNYAYEPLLNVSAMKQLADCKPDKIFTIKYFIRLAQVMIKGFINYDFTIALLLAIFWSIFCFINTHDIKRLILPIYQFGMIALLEGYLYIRGRYLQRRVDVILILAAVMVLMLYAWNTEAFILPIKSRSALVLASLALLTLNLAHLCEYHEDKVSQNSQAQLQQEMRDLVSQDQDHYYLYIYNWNYYPDKNFNAFKVYEKGHFANTTALGNWRIITPTVQDALEEYGITDCYADMVDNDTVYLISYKDSSYIKLVQNLIRTHYDDQATVKLVKQVGVFGIYRVVSGNVTLDTTEAEAVPADIHQNVEMSYDDESSTLEISGSIYMEGENSFASNIYVAFTDLRTGKVSYVYGNQSADEMIDDNYNGRYGYFTAEYKRQNDHDYDITIYFENDGTLYEIPLGVMSDVY